MTLQEALQFIIKESTRFVSPPAIATEWVITLIAAASVFVWPWGVLQGGNARFVQLANRRRLAVVISGLLPVVLRLALMPWIPIPDPSIHDEFSHLLLADTLAHGRLANPPHLMWRHFETIHVINQPTYASMYPPAQDSFLALGEILFHQPWAGVVIAVGVMCAAICWMMQAWIPPAWAFYGSLLMILKIGVEGFWMNSFIGGAVPAIAGAILVGSLPRLRNDRSKIGSALLLGLSLAMLINTRPFEGGLLAAASLLYIAPTIWKNPRTVLLPATLVLCGGVVFTGYYNWRVTGHANRLGYQVNRDTYGWPENLAFLPAKAPIFHNQVLKDMYLKELNHRTIYASAERLIDNLVTRLYDNWTFFIGPLLTIPLLAVLSGLRDKTTRFLVLLTGLIVGLNLFQMVLYPFHLGPVVPIIFTLLVIGTRQLWRSLPEPSPKRVMLVAIIPLCLVVVGAMKQEARYLNLPLAYWDIAAEPHRDARANMQNWLYGRSAKQLVIVRYEPWHNPDQEWVYNGADIDGSKVVWARALSLNEDGQLARYFAGREIWRLNADQYPPRLSPYVAGK